MHPKRLSYDNPAYEKWIKSKPCIVCGQSPVDPHHMYHARRNTYLLAPVCRRHHSFGPESYHHLEHKAWEERHNLCADWEVIKLLSEFIEKGRE